MLTECEHPEAILSASAHRKFAATLRDLTHLATIIAPDLLRFMSITAVEHVEE